MTKFEIIILAILILLIIAVINLYRKKPITIKKYNDGTAWFDQEGNMINSTSKLANKKK